jgi:hypothetical protein
MADYNAHTYFGMRVLEELPADLRRQCAEDLPVYRLGLYGPDPLIFSFRTKPVSDQLHKNWREDTLPNLERAIRRGSPTSRSFGAGCLLHFFLDEVVHPEIYRWMEDGSSHFRLELALDNLIIEEQHLPNLPRLFLQGKERTARAAAAYLHPAREDTYLTGLGRMAALTACLRAQHDRVISTVTTEEWKQAGQMRRDMEEKIPAAAAWLQDLLETG